MTKAEQQRPQQPFGRVRQGRGISQGAVATLSQRLDHCGWHVSPSLGDTLVAYAQSICSTWRAWVECKKEKRKHVSESGRYPQSGLRQATAEGLATGVFSRWLQLSRLASRTELYIAPAAGCSWVVGFRPDEDEGWSQGSRIKNSQWRGDDARERRQKQK